MSLSFEMMNVNEHTKNIKQNNIKDSASLNRTQGRQMLNKSMSQKIGDMSPYIAPHQTYESIITEDIQEMPSNRQGDTSACAENEASSQTQTEKVISIETLE